VRWKLLYAFGELVNVEIDYEGGVVFR